MAVAYKSAGSGASTETSGAALSPACPAMVDAGDVLIAHVFWEGTTTAPSTPSGWELLSGPHIIETSVARHWVYGRVADGTEDGAAVAFGSPAVTTQRAARVYSFSGRVSGDIALLCQGFSHQSHATDPQMPTVTTVRAGALAVSLVAQNDNNATGNATGESGGNWTEAVAEYTVALTPGLTLQIQTCTPTSNPGTVSGGSVSTTNDPCGVIGFYIQDVAETPKVSTDTLGVTFTDSAGVYLRSVVCSDTITGFADDWRLLTDNDTFTYYNCTDSLTVRLNGAATGGSTEEKAPSESLSLGLTDTAIAIATLSVTDDLINGLSDVFTGSQAFSAVDSLSCGVSDVPVIFSSISATDATAAQCEDITSILSTLSCSDSFLDGLTDTIAQVAAVIASTDSLAIVSTEDSTLASSVVCSDSVPLGLADTFTGSQLVSALDSLAIQTNEDVFNTASAFTDDSIVIHADDLSDITQTFIAAIDDCAAQCIESANLLQNTLVSVADSLNITCDEALQIGLSWSATDSLASIIEDSFTGSQALSVSEDFGLLLSEYQFSSVLAAASDAVTPAASDAVTVFMDQFISDAIAIQLADSASNQDIESAIPKSSQDVCTVLLEEGAVTELAGPYWSGHIWEDHALVYADSYVMGRRENPGKVRW